MHSSTFVPRLHDFQSFNLMVLRWCKRWDVRLEAAGHQLVRLDGWIIFMQHHRTLEVFTMYFAGSYCATVILRITSKIGISYLTHNCQQIFSIVITIWIYFIICSLQLCTMPFKKTRQLETRYLKYLVSIGPIRTKKQHYQLFLLYMHRVLLKKKAYGLKTHLTIDIMTKASSESVNRLR